MRKVDNDTYYAEVWKFHCLDEEFNEIQAKRNKQKLILDYLDKGFTVEEVEKLLKAYDEESRRMFPLGYVPDFDSWVPTRKDEVLNK